MGEAHGAITERRTFTPYKLFPSPRSLQIHSLSTRDPQETFIAQAGTPGRSGTQGRPQGFSIPQSHTREPSSSTREKHGEAAEGTWHAWRTVPLDQVPRESSTSAVGNVSPSKERRLWPSYFLSSDRFFFPVRQKSCNQIPNESHSKHTSNSSAVADPRKSCQFGDPQDLRNRLVPRAQRTPSPAFRARQGLVPNPAASPSSSQEGEMLQVFRKQSTASGSPRKRASRIWSKIPTIKVARLFTATPVHFSQDIYVRVQGSHPPLSSAIDVNLCRKCSCERSGLQTRSQHWWGRPQTPHLASVYSVQANSSMPMLSVTALFIVQICRKRTSR